VNADTTLPPWLIIVHRDKDTLYHNLRQAFESDPRVTVIKDRRRADRRKETVALQSERRQLDRRLPLTAEGEKIWQSLRFRLIHRDDKLTVYQAGEPPEGHCLRQLRRSRGNNGCGREAVPKRENLPVPRGACGLGGDGAESVMAKSALRVVGWTGSARGARCATAAPGGSPSGEAGQG
jgi:hypothetical protein